MMKLKTGFGVLALAALVVVTSGVAAPALATTSAIFTTNCNRSVVNQNLYDNAQDVYLNGGPNSNPLCGNPNLAPDGDWYFQVTDPSSAASDALLSTDPLNCRVVTVTGGFITAYNPAVGCPAAPNPSVACETETDAHPTLGSADTDTGGETNGPHNSGTPLCGSGITVQLFPFSQTTNPGGEYKVWMMPKVDLPSGCDSTQVDPGNCGPSGSTHGFVEADSKTDNFKSTFRTLPVPSATYSYFRGASAGR